MKDAAPVARFHGRAKTRAGQRAGPGAPTPVERMNASASRGTLFLDWTAATRLDHGHHPALAR